MSITYTLFIYLARYLTDIEIGFTSHISIFRKNIIDFESRDYFYVTAYYIYV
jgi:hypothetical protein